MQTRVVINLSKCSDQGQVSKPACWDYTAVIGKWIMMVLTMFCNQLLLLLAVCLLWHLSFAVLFCLGYVCSIPSNTFKSTMASLFQPVLTPFAQNSGSPSVAPCRTHLLTMAVLNTFITLSCPALHNGWFRILLYDTEWTIIP